MQGEKRNEVSLQEQQESLPNRCEELARQPHRDVILFKDLYQRCEETIQKAQTICKTLSELNSTASALSPPIFVLQKNVKDKK